MILKNHFPEKFSWQRVSVADGTLFQNKADICGHTDVLPKSAA